MKEQEPKQEQRPEQSKITKEKPQMAIAIQKEQEKQEKQKNMEGFYQLRNNGMPFGSLYMNSDICTLSWQGEIDFSKLDQEVLGSLPTYFKPESSLHHGHGQGTRKLGKGDRVRATFILEEKDLVEYDFTKPEQYEQYMDTIKHPNKISFARYDVLHPSGPDRKEYSFTAENPQWASDLNELAICLPRSLQWSEGVMKWIISHHGEELSKQVDPQNLAATISEISCS